MTTTLATFLAQVEILLGPDDANLELESYNIEPLIKAAVERYSNDRPNSATVSVTGDAGRYYAIATALTSWVEGFSSIRAIEYPAAVVASDELPQYLDPEDWRDDFFDGATRYLYLPNHTPAATEAMRITYTVPYVWAANATATPTADFYAICHLAAGLSCQAIAAKYSRTTDSTIAADSVAHTSRAGEFARRAREYIDFYSQHMGLPDSKAGGAGAVMNKPAAGTFVDMDTTPTWPSGRRFLYHDEDTR